MNKKTIELELRAEVSARDQAALKKHLAALGVLRSRTKRLSVMYFGSLGRKKLDIRVRITNGESEVVVKSGSFASHNRVEIAQKIDRAQFLGMVKLFSQFDFSMEIGERETFNYVLPGNIMASLVSAGPLIYIELEKMSAKADADKNNRQLKKLAARLKLRILNKAGFDALCQRLAKTVDWSFHGTTRDYKKLNKLINRYVSYQIKSS